MLLRSCLAKLMVQVDPGLYRKYLTYGKNNEPLLYVKLSKAIYGLLKSALLFSKKFFDDLTKYSPPFTINPYDPCVAHTTNAGYQITITWHVNDLKISHSLSKSPNFANILPQSMKTALWSIMVKSTSI
jgi:hypothetical protein